MLVDIFVFARYRQDCWRRVLLWTNTRKLVINIDNPRNMGYKERTKHNDRYMSVASSPKCINVVRNWEVSCMLFSLHLGWVSLLPAEHEFPGPTAPWFGVSMWFEICPRPWDLKTMGRHGTLGPCGGLKNPSAEWKSVSMIKTVGVLLDWFSMIFLQTNGLNLWGMDSRFGHTANLLPGKAWRRPSFDWPA